MYFDLLTPGNTEFVQSIGRILGYKSTRLSNNVISAFEAAQKVFNQASLLTLLNAHCRLGEYRTRREFANRGGSNGVAYRLWMETKQFLASSYNQRFTQPNPPMSTTCPGTELLGIYVPEGEGRTSRGCHAFALSLGYCSRQDDRISRATCSKKIWQL